MCKLSSLLNGISEFPDCCNETCCECANHECSNCCNFYCNSIHALCV